MSLLRIELDSENSEHIRQISQDSNRSAQSIVNEILRKVEIIIPDKIPMKLGEIKHKSKSKQTA